MTDYPVMMRLRGRRCVVVGGGAVGRRKAEGLVAAGADVVLIDPVANVANSPSLTVRKRAFAEPDVDGATLVIAATDDPDVNRSVAAAARRRNIPVCQADNPQQSDFTLPAVCRVGDLLVAVATGGASPAAAALVRDEIARLLPAEWSVFLDIAREMRSRELTRDSKAAYNQRVLQNLVSKGILDLIARADAPGIDRLLESELGKGCSLAELGVSLSKGAS